jgi:hypothetical protein
MPKWRRGWLNEPKQARDVFEAWISKARRPPGVNEAGEAIQEEVLEVLQLERVLLWSRKQALGILRRCLAKKLFKSRRDGRLLYVSLA